MKCFLNTEELCRCQQRTFQLDVSCLQSIAQFGEEMAREQRTIDVLVQNAGIMGLPFEVPNYRITIFGEFDLLQLSSDNVEMHFATHCFGPSLLVRHLLECFERSSDPRVIMVSSGYYKKVGIGFLIINRKFAKVFSSKKKIDFSQI